MKKKAFTLIELLIVIAIIAILALIAVPNFMEAQTRAKVSRVQADMRSIATAMEAYFVDFNTYPWRITISRVNWAGPFQNFLDHTPGTGGWRGITGLTTPIAYFANRLPADPFAPTNPLDDDDPTPPWGGAKDFSFYFLNFLGASQMYDAIKPNDYETGWGTRVDRPFAPVPFNISGREYHVMWALRSPGPSRKGDAYQFDQILSSSSDVYFKNIMDGDYHIYDPSNGTISEGSILRFNDTSPHEK